MPFSLTWRNAFLDAVLKGTAFPTLPSALYVGLSSTEPTSAGGNVTEPAAGDYARVSCRANIAAASGGISSNSTTITLTASAGEDWGTFGWVVFYDAATSGNFIGYGVISPTLTINTGGVGTIGPSDLDFTT